jgi:translation initiation factor 6 (eIF-6)
VVGEKSYNQPLALLHVNNGSFSLADRMLQYNTAMELYAMHEQLANTVAGIVVKQKATSEKLATATDKKLKKALEDYAVQLETLRGTLIPTKSSSIFVTDEKLRENISEIYGSVCSTEAAPGNLQLERVKALKGNVTEAEQQSATITQQFEEKIKRIIVKPTVKKRIGN